MDNPFNSEADALERELRRLRPRPLSGDVLRQVAAAIGTLEAEGRAVCDGPRRWIRVAALAATLLVLAGATGVVFRGVDPKRLDAPAVDVPARGPAAPRLLAGTVFLGGLDAGVETTDATGPFRRYLLRHVDVVAFRDPARGVSGSARVPRETVAWVSMPVD
jgi:hypothetical protein